ncbi:MAG: hypothetical protein WBK91_07545 [Alphaproteobacteria bacterium]
MLSITTPHQPATDSGYRRHKTPENLHSVTVNFDPAHVFFPEASPERCTASTLFLCKQRKWLLSARALRITRARY